MELPREIWSPHSWRGSRKVFDVALWAGDKVGIRHSWTGWFWEVFSNLNDPRIL